VIASSFFLFILAGLCEIGGGYLVWQWLREGKSAGLALLGAVILVLYGVIPTFQPAHFGRVYAAYGGIFIVMALLWGWLVDKIAPDRIDLIGAAIALVGVSIMMYWPRAAA
jgi:small multidrug resistance family-3 protein